MTDCLKHEGAETVPHRLLCSSCADKMDRALGEMDRLFDSLSLDLPGRNPDDPPASHGKISGSPALIRLDSLALADPRTRWDGDPDSPRYWPEARTEWGWPVPDEVIDEVLGLWRQLRSATGQPRNTEGAPVSLGRCDCGGRLVSDGQAEPLPQCGTCMRRFATLTVKQAAERLGCTERVIYKRIAIGQIERTGRGQVDVRSLMRWREGRLSSQC